MRDRSFERSMEIDYIEQLREVYEAFFSSYARTPLLIIDTNQLDYVHSLEDLQVVIGAVRTMLQENYQRVVI